MKSLGDVVVDALSEFLTNLFQSALDFIGEKGNDLLNLIISTPRPDAVFSRPTNQGWPAIYDFYWDTIVPLSLLLWALSLGLIIFLESTSHLFSSYHRTKLKKRAFSGLLGILSWWWIAALSLRFIDSLASFLLPSLADITLFDVTSFGAMGVLGVVVSATVDLILFLIIALLYYMRQVVLYLYVLLMPLLIVFWVPGVGPLTLASRFMQRMAGFYVPFLFMTIPVALLLRLGKLLGGSASVSLGGFGQWLVAITIPFVAVAMPFVLFWQAGALFFMADRAAQHSSTQRAQNRFRRFRDAGQSVQQGQQNFRRGVRGEPAVRSDGQTVMDSGSSRAHDVGTRVSELRSSLRETFQSTSSGEGSQATTRPDQARPEQRDHSDADSDDDQPDDWFEALKQETGSADESATDPSSPPSDDNSTDPDSSSDADGSDDTADTDDTDESDDDRPRYIY